MIDEISEFLFAGTVGLLGWFFGGLDGFFKVLITFAVVDQISGICAAGKKGEISSAAGFKGIARKIVMFALVGLSHIIDQHILGNSDALRAAVCIFYIGNEGISIIENADKLGVPIPKFLRGKFFNFLKKGLESEEIPELPEANKKESKKDGQIG